MKNFISDRLNRISEKMSAELACTYAALILNDDDVEITGDKITAILKVFIEKPSWILNIKFSGRQRRLWTILAITLRWCPQGRRCPQLDHQHRFRCWFRPSCRRCRRRWWWCCRCWSTKGRSQEGRILIRRRRRYGFRTFRLKAMPVGFLELQIKRFSSVRTLSFYFLQECYTIVHIR